MNGMLYVYKSMLNKLQNEWRAPLIFILLASMMVGLFISRALLSVSMISFVIISFFHPHPKEQVRAFFHTPLLWGMSLLFFIPLVSGAWSENTQQWADIMRIKLPLFFLPLAFAAPFGFSGRHWHWLALLFIFLLVLVSGWSIIKYAGDMAAINQSYLQAKTMVTGLGNDHVRFSWLVATGILLSSWLCWQSRHRRNIIFWALFGAGTWLILYLHLLAARTGLVSFYMMLAAAVFLFFFSRKRPARAIFLISLLLVLPVVAYLVLPSFRNRMDYMRYDFSYFRDARYLPGANDAVRLISIRTGWEVMNDHPLTGVGFGDIATEVRSRYGKAYPEMVESDKILPGSEWMMYGAGTGWPGFIAFSAIMIIPFFTRIKPQFCWWLLNATAAFSFIFDIGLEVQFGVFIYSFMIALCWKWMVTEKI